MGKFSYPCPGCGQAQTTRDEASQNGLCAACLETKGGQISLIEEDRQRKFKTLDEQEASAKKGRRKEA